MRMLLAPLVFAVSLPEFTEAKPKISTLQILYSSLSDRRSIRYYWNHGMIK
jgi:hypothetical protein